MSTRYAQIVLDSLQRDGQEGWSLLDVAPYPPDPYGEFIRKWLHQPHYGAANARVITVGKEGTEQRYVVFFDPYQPEGYQYQVISFKQPKHTLLVIDASARYREVLREVFESEGYMFVESSNGKDAISLILAYKPDLVLFDLFLPDMCGVEFGQLLYSMNVRVQTMRTKLSTLQGKGMDEKPYLLLSMNYIKREWGRRDRCSSPPFVPFLMERIAISTHALEHGTLFHIGSFIVLLAHSYP